MKINYETLMLRRSVRKFSKTKKLSTDAILEIIDIMNTAPTAMNARNIKPIAIRNQEIKNKLSKTHDWTGFLADADTIIILVYTDNYHGLSVDEIKVADSFCKENVQSMVSYAQAYMALEKIGSCQTGVDEFDSSIIESNTGYKNVVGMVGIGYSDMDENSDYRITLPSADITYIVE